MKTIHPSLIRVAGLVSALIITGMPLKAELLYGLSQNTLFTFDSSSPGAVSNVRPITGLGLGESLLGIDIRPATGELFALGSSERLFTIDPNTGIASMINSTPFATSTGTVLGFDFNPVPDAIRATSDTAENFRVSPGGVLLGTDGTLAYAVEDPNFGQDPAIVAVGYGNNVAGATSTSLSAIDSDRDALVMIASPNSGVLTTIGLLGVNTTDDIGFDISGVSGIAYASLTGPGADNSGLYEINLQSGAATLLGEIGVAGALDGLTVIPEPSSWVMFLAGCGVLLTRRLNSRNRESVIK